MKEKENNNSTLLAKKVANNIQASIAQTQANLFGFLNQMEEALENGVAATEQTEALTKEQVLAALGDELPKVSARLEALRKAATA